MKPKREINKHYLVWIRTLPCLISGGQSEPSHTQTKGRGIMGSKVSDKRAIPLSHELHMEYHNGRDSFAKKYNLDYEMIIARLNEIWESRTSKLIDITLKSEAAEDTL